MSDRNHISRKDFLKKSSAGVISLGVLGGITPVSKSETKTSPASPKFRILGRTGLKVSAVGFGATRTMEPSLVKYALDQGINFFDTGRHYFNGQNEQMVGQALKGKRQEVIIQTKMQVRLREQGEALKTGAVSKKIQKIMQKSLEGSLKALQTDYIDVMLLHRIKSTEIIGHETVLNFLESAKKKGQIRAFGFSSHHLPVELLRVVNQNKLYDVIMIPYNHKGSYVHSKYGYHSEWDQPALEKELRAAKKNNLGIVAMKTCSGGPYTADSNSKPTFQAGLKWILNHDYISTMAVAMANFDEVNEDIQAMF